MRSERMTEIEVLAARATIQAAVKYLQNRQEAFPKHASPKLLIVEIEYDIDDGEAGPYLTVRKVTRNGKRVHAEPSMSIGGPYWLLFQSGEENLALEQVRR